MWQQSDRYVLLIPVVLTGLVLLSLACGGGEAEGDKERPSGVAIVVTSPSGSVTPRPRRTTIATASPSPTPLQVCAPNPDPALPKALQVQAPVANASVGIPVHVRGWGSNIGEQNKGVFIALVNDHQSVLQVNRVPPQPREFRVAPEGMEITEFTRPFAIDIVINDLEEETPYCIWVYQDTDDQGHARGVVQIPVVVLPR
ncbi:MAG: hypothetical protein WD904_02720 [Dehalococcoidia bacterium]